MEFSRYFLPNSEQLELIDILEEFNFSSNLILFTL